VVRGHQPRKRERGSKRGSSALNQVYQSLRGKKDHLFYRQVDEKTVGETVLISTRNPQG